MKILKKIICICLVAILAAGLFPGAQTEVYAAGKPVQLVSCKLNSGGSKVTVKAKVAGKQKGMGNKLYLFSVDANVKENAKLTGKPVASANFKKGTVTFSVKYKSSMLCQKFVAAYKKGKKYAAISGAQYITNPEVLASYTGTGVKTTSKKGLQPDWADHTSVKKLRTQHVVLNWSIEEILNKDCGNKEVYKYRGKKYTFDRDRVNWLQDQVRQYIDDGSKVYVILLLGKDAKGQAGKMSYGGGKIFSSIKTTSAAGCRTWEAFMSYMAEKFGNEQHLVSGWILGNEVDSPYDWNYAGGKSLSAYMDDYARAFRIAYNATKSVSSHSKVYISLDYNWNQDVDGGGNSFFSTKKTLDTFYSKLKAQGKICPNIAYHAYSQGLVEPKFWDDSLAGSGVDSTIITMKNISVLTEYVKKKIGKDATIMLAEQAFNSTQGEELQAATYAYAYYISEGNKMIESFIYARDTEPQSDVDQAFYWGLRDINGRERKIYNTFKVIDSKESLDKTKNLLSYTDLSSWTQIPGIKKSTFKNNRSIKNKWPLVQSTSLYVCLADDNWQRETTYVYDGKKHKPAVTVKRNYTGKTVPKKNYSVKYLTDCRSIGVHRIQIKLKGDFRGTIIREFTIAPQNAMLNDLVMTSNSATVSWNVPKKTKEQITGYMIQYTDGEGGFYSTPEKDIHLIKIKNSNKLKYTIKGLTKGKRYFVRITTYKTVMVDGKPKDIIAGWGYDDIKYDYATDPVVPEPDTEEDTLE